MKTALAGAEHTTHHTPKGAPYSTRKSQRAGTLVEVVMATAILAMMGGGIIGSINYGMFMMRLARENARATQIMLEKLESIRLYDWYEVTSNGFVPAAFTDVYDPQGATNQQGAVYNGSLTIGSCPVGTSYATNMRLFTVTVNWTTAGKINHSRSNSTYVARDGLQNYVY